MKNRLVPRLRFKEFSGEWEERKLEKISKSKNSNISLNRVELQDEGYPVYGADGIAGYINEYQHEDKYISVVKDGSGVGRLNLCEEKSSIVGTLTSIKSKDNSKYMLEWIYYLLGTFDFRKFIMGSGIPHIYYSDYKNEFISVPSYQEQQKIANTLSSLDTLIESEQTKLEQLQEHKKGLMQNLFPQEGETMPKVRFKEFENDGEWEEMKLGKIGKFSKGKGISKANIEENGALECIRYGELYTHYNEVIEEVISRTNVPSEQLVLSKKNDVIIPASGETQEDIATASCVLKDGVALGGDLNIIRTKLNGVFLAYYLNNAKKREIASMSQGVSVIHLYPNQLKSLIIHAPQKEEQQKIANTLSSLDKTIRLKTERIELLHQHKKGLMQGLFPSAE